MDPRKVFTCQNCDAEMEVEDPRLRDRVACPQCGRLHRLVFDEPDQAWLLRTEEAAEEEQEESRKDQPFSVLGEVGRPKKVDRSEEHREQTDTRPDDEIATDEPKQPG